LRFLGQGSADGQQEQNRSDGQCKPIRSFHISATCPASA
jgi:hypothetical protein